MAVVLSVAVGVAAAAAAAIATVAVAAVKRLVAGGTSACSTRSSDN